MKILVLAGGASSEREVSLNSGEAIAKGLRSLGHAVKMIDTLNGLDLIGVSREKIEEITRMGSGAASQVMVAESPVVPMIGIPADFREVDCVFIALHGGIGENGTLQALLEMAGVAYTGSGVLASALAMDKHRAKIMFRSVGIPTPETIFYGDRDGALLFCKENEHRLEFPIIVKPNAEGSTVGLTKAESFESLLTGIDEAAQCDSFILIEEFIPGRELTVAILGREALPVIEIIPKSGLYDYKAKYTAGASEYVCPAEISKKVAKEAALLAQRAFEVLGCSGYARVDFRLDPENRLFCLEVNTLPGMTSTSLVPKAAKAVGMTFEQLLQRIIEESIKNKS